MSTISNPANGGFILAWKKPGTVTANNETTGFEIENAFTKYPTKVYQSTTNTIEIKMTYETPWKLTGIALINHNLTSTAAIQLLYYTDPNFSTLAEEKTIQYSPKNTFLIIDDTIGQYRYIKLAISDTALTTIRIGVIFPGTGFQFPHNYSWNFTEDFFVVKDVDTTDGGFHEETPNEEEEIPAPEYSKFEITFSSVDPNLHDIYKNLIRAGNKIFIPSYTGINCYYGIVPNKNLKAHKEKKGDTYTIQFWEHSLLGATN